MLAINKFNPNRPQSTAQSAAEPKFKFFPKLPPELREHIISSCEYTDLKNMATVNREAYQLFRSTPKTVVTKVEVLTDRQFAEHCSFVQNPQNNIKTIKLIGYKLSEEKFIQLVDAIASNDNITGLDLSQTKIDDFTDEVVIISLGKLKGLESLDLSNNFLSFKINKLSGILEKLPKLKNLKFCNNGFGDFNNLELELILKSLKGADNLSELEFNNNSLVSPLRISTLELIKILGEKKTFKALIIKDHGLKSEDLAKILALLPNASLITK